MSGSNEPVEEVADIQSGPNPLRVHLRKVEARNKELEAKLAEAIRKLAFFEAGVNPNSSEAKYFVKGYDGEMAPEAIRAAAEVANISFLPR